MRCQGVARRGVAGTSATAQANSRHVFLMEDALQGYFVTPPDRSLSIYKFDFDRDPQRMDAHSWIFNTDSDVKLAGFQAKGGKLMFIHGLADPIFSADEMVDYYQRLTSQNGPKTNEFARLFLVPGMGHCAGGAATGGESTSGAATTAWGALGVTSSTDP